MSVTEILSKVAANEITATEASKLIESLRGNSAPRAISYKVSLKGAVSAYGLSRWPTTLYASQWEALDSDAERKRRAEFIKANAAKLSRKNAA